MISQSIQDAMNEQINYEFASAYIYLAMSSHFEEANLSGCAHWMKHQAEEEVEHAMRLYGYIHDRGGRVQLKAIAQPPAKFGSPRETFQAALNHEISVTERINRIYDLAIKENDQATQVHLHWFIQEQVEEEKSAGDIIAMFDMAGGNAGAILTIDHTLSQRIDAH